MKAYTILTFFLLIFVNQLYSQNESVNTVYSENKLFLFKTTPYSVQDYDTIGKTEVIHLSDTSIFYSIDRYYDSYLFALSNDGITIMEVGKDTKIRFYKYGKKTSEIDLQSLIHTKKSDDLYDYLYHFTLTTERSKNQRNFEIEAYAHKSPLFVYRDTAYLFTSNDTILLFDIPKSILIGKVNMYDKNINFPLENSQIIIHRNYFEPPSWSSLPKLIDGSSFEYSLADFLGMVYDEQQVFNFKYYEFSIKCIINSDGKALGGNFNFELDFNRDSIVNFLEKIRFDTTIFPKEIDNWVFNDWIYNLRKEDENIAKQEFQTEKLKKEEEYKLQLVSDPINGIYIPKDIEDCIKQLDKNLSEDWKEEFLESGNSEHFGIGLWIRNNWGLWCGSRLYVYFKENGITHPDRMSGIILDIYYKYLKDNSIILNEELNRIINNR